MQNVLALARITFWEGIRNRSLFGIALFALFMLGLNIAVAGFFMRDIGKVTVDMNLSAQNLAGLLLIFSIGLNLVAKDIDKKTIQIVLSKPISRLEYVLGKYLGIVSFTFFSLLILFIFSCVTVALLRNLHADYFLNFLWANYLIASVFVLVKFALLAAVAMFFATIATSAFVALICSLSVYVIGIIIEDVVFYLKSEIAIQEKVVSPALESFIGFVSYGWPNFSVFDFSLEAAHGLNIQPDRMLFALAYAVVYIAMLLCSSACIFSRREFH